MRSGPTGTYEVAVCTPDGPVTMVTYIEELRDALDSARSRARYGHVKTLVIERTRSGPFVVLRVQADGRVEEA